MVINNKVLLCWIRVTLGTGNKTLTFPTTYSSVNYVVVTNCEATYSFGNWYGLISSKTKSSVTVVGTKETQNFIVLGF